MKLCKDCKWHKVPRYFFKKDWTFAKCANPEIQTGQALVAGIPEEYCSVQRIAFCGPAGKYFESKEEKRV